MKVALFFECTEVGIQHQSKGYVCNDEPWQHAEQIIPRNKYKVQIFHSTGIVLEQPQNESIRVVSFLSPQLLKEISYEIWMFDTGKLFLMS